VEPNTPITNNSDTTSWLSLLENGDGLALWELDLASSLIVSPCGLERLLRIPTGSFDGTLEAFMACVHSEDRVWVRSKLTACSHAESSLHFRTVHPDGSVTRLQSRLHGLAPDAQGRPTRLRGILRDVSDQSHYRDRILAVAGVVGRAHGSESLPTLVRALGEATSADLCLVARFETDGLIERARHVAVWKRIPLPDMTTWPIADSPFLEVRHGRASVHPSNVAAAFPNHPLGQVLLTQGFVAVPLFDALGQVLGCVASLSRQPMREDPEAIRDLMSIFAPRAAAELSRQDIAADLVTSQERLHQAEKMDALGRLAGGIAHDFNNMLAGIMGAAELLGARLGVDSPHQRLIRTVVQSADRAADLTRKLLSFSRKAPVQRRQIDLRKPVEEALVILERSIDRCIAVRRDLGAGSVVVAGDPGLLQAMVLNLCMNACDAMPRGGTLSVTVHAVSDRERDETWNLQGRLVQLTVADSGMGMDPATAARIFEPFFTTKMQGSGTGLGLAAAYGTIQEHGGAVRVETAPGKGTIIRIRLPLLTGVASDPPTDRVTQTAMVGKVLLVDDEDLVRQSTGELLASMGWQVVHARDGEEGIRRFMENPGSFNLAVVDSVMPRLDGLGCFRGLREARKDLPVVFCSGYTRDRTRTEMPGDPRIAFVQKPFRLAELVRAIQSVRQPT